MKGALGAADLAVLAVTVLLVAAAPLVALSLNLDDAAATGKVTAYEPGKIISVAVGNEKKEFKIDGDTQVEGELAVGKEVEVWAKDGTATKIVVKP